MVVSQLSNNASTTSIISLFRFADGKERAECNDVDVKRRANNGSVVVVVRGCNMVERMVGVIAGEGVGVRM